AAATVAATFDRLCTEGRAHHARPFYVRELRGAGRTAAIVDRSRIEHLFFDEDTGNDRTNRVRNTKQTDTETDRVLRGGKANHHRRQRRSNASDVVRGANRSAAHGNRKTFTHVGGADRVGRAIEESEDQKQVRNVGGRGRVNQDRQIDRGQEARRPPHRPPAENVGKVPGDDLAEDHH